MPRVVNTKAVHFSDNLQRSVQTPQILHSSNTLTGKRLLHQGSVLGHQRLMYQQQSSQHRVNHGNLQDAQSFQQTSSHQSPLNFIGAEVNGHISRAPSDDIAFVDGCTGGGWGQDNNTTISHPIINRNQNDFEGNYSPSQGGFASFFQNPARQPQGETTNRLQNPVSPATTSYYNRSVKSSSHSYMPNNGPSIAKSSFAPNEVMSKKMWLALQKLYREKQVPQPRLNFRDDDGSEFLKDVMTHRSADGCRDQNEEINDDNCMNLNLSEGGDNSSSNSKSSLLGKKRLCFSAKGDAQNLFQKNKSQGSQYQLKGSTSLHNLPLQNVKFIKDTALDQFSGKCEQHSQFDYTDQSPYSDFQHERPRHKVVGKSTFAKTQSFHNLINLKGIEDASPN
ncbi:hypothetical protein FGO68_gene10016 [Halteria grandinella]|uniref:Uncharacterized protein n=1 Tax=Halteria grandinella TaxID=5974 RepID=A0A8J8SYC4_HALGN|nr:hypothetical protein FGO68_gene10016 [Halteria grandinella]